MRIAVIGTGISGMVAAHLLAGSHDLVVYEANDYAGGHTHTVDVEAGGKRFAVDTGFIVFNEVTYPNFVRLLKKLGVRWKPSQMSFSVKCEESGLEYRPSSLGTLFAQKKNLVSPTFYRMIYDLFRFRRESEALLDQDDYGKTLDQYLQDKGYSRMFAEKFILPMGAAIWSADSERFREFPARYFVEFFKNHGFLKVRNQPQWLVIEGGSRRYMEELIRPFAERIRLNSPVEWVKRRPDAVEVKARGEDPERFDAVIIAAHSDQALTMLEDASEAERDILSSIPYQENLTLLHTDATILPQRRACWASWNYYIPSREKGRQTVTYDMNILQGLDAPVEFCVTLNLEGVLNPAKIIRKIPYAHPVYTSKSLPAQGRREEINGVNRTYFCGAYWGYGFHEDGVKSALAVAKHFGKTL
jgi:predicted NAD/FAD-binding protein